MDKLVRKLRRELTRNPKKTGLLALGLGVAVYFWAPLIAKWVGKPTSPAPVADGAAPIETAIATTESQPPLPDALVALAQWQALAKQIETDPRRAAAPNPAAGRDPFFANMETLVQEAANAEQEIRLKEAEAAAALAAPAFTQGSWKLQGIVRGGRVPAAIVNGAIYRERERLLAPTAAATSEGEPAAAIPEAMLLTIGADHVVLRVGVDTTVRIDLERPRLAPGDSLVPVSTVREN